MVETAEQECVNYVFDWYDFNEDPYVIINTLGCEDSVAIGTCYGLDGLGFEFRWDDILRTRRDWPWAPLSFLYSGYRVSFPGIKQSGRGIKHPPPTSAEVKERVEL